MMMMMKPQQQWFLRNDHERAEKVQKNPQLKPKGSNLTQQLVVAKRTTLKRFLSCSFQCLLLLVLITIILLQ